MKRAVIIGFLLLLAIDTFQQVMVKLAGNRLGECCSHEWLQRVGS